MGCKVKKPSSTDLPRNFAIIPETILKRVAQLPISPSDQHFVLQLFLDKKDSQPRIFYTYLIQLEKLFGKKE